MKIDTTESASKSRVTDGDTTGTAASLKPNLLEAF